MAAPDERTHYQVLGIDADAPVATIRAVFRERAMGAHPDQGGDERAFRRLLQAYETLVDPEARREYDRKIGVRRFAPQSASHYEPTKAWEGTRGAGFTGDVDFPSWLRDVTDAPWRPSEEPAAPGPEHEPVLRVAADVAWWFPKGIGFRPVVVGQLVVLCQDDAVVALDVLTGHEVWRAGLAAAPAGPPINLGGVIVVATVDGDLHGLELLRGITLWQGNLLPPGMVCLEVGGGAVVAAGNGRLRVVSPTDGRAGRPVRLGGPAVSLVVHEGTAVVVSRDAVEGVDVRSGRHRWRIRSSLGGAPPVSVGGVVCVAAGRGRIAWMDVATGAFHGATIVGLSVAGLAAAGANALVSASGPSAISAVSPNGSIAWSTTTTGVCLTPVVADDRVVAVGVDGVLRTLDGRNGAVVAESSISFDAAGTPVLAGDRVLLTDRGGTVWTVAVPGS